MNKQNKNKPPVIIEDGNRKNNNTVLIVVFSIVIFILLALAALGWGLFLYQKKKSGPTAKNLSSGIGEASQKIRNQPDKNMYPTAIPENPSYAENSNQNLNPESLPELTEEGFQPPTTSEKSMGYIKKAYVKNDKNYLDIDYIQWLSGTEAEKAMREDGQCPKKGECIVYNDYYIRNQNPLIRTFEVPTDADIRMQTLDSETTGSINQNKKITFEKLKDIFAPASTYKDRYQYAPFIVEISNQQAVKIIEQYIP